jgi:hypothetical protein
MAQLVGSGKVIDGTVSVGITAAVKTQSLNIVGRRKQTIVATTDKALSFVIQISLNKDQDSDYVTTPDAATALVNGASAVVNVDYVANFMRLLITGGASAALPVITISSLAMSR